MPMPDGTFIDLAIANSVTYIAEGGSATRKNVIVSKLADLNQL